MCKNLKIDTYDKGKYEDLLYSNRDRITGDYIVKHLKLGQSAQWIHREICYFLGGEEGIVRDKDLSVIFSEALSPNTIAKGLNTLIQNNVYTRSKVISDSYPARFISCNICSNLKSLPVSWNITGKINRNRQSFFTCNIRPQKSIKE